MANPTISSAGIVLNKKANKKSRFSVTGTNFTDPSTVKITNPTGWTADTKYKSSTLLTVVATAPASTMGVNDTGDITITVTNNQNETSQPLTVQVVFVSEDT
jgi:hypothetical protein